MALAFRLSIVAMLLVALGCEDGAAVRLDALLADAGTEDGAGTDARGDAAIVEVACADGIDDDGDGQTDCADADCAADARCGVETACGDGVDDDADGGTDCQDLDCDGVGGCEYAVEVTCLDGDDNDGDLVADCSDADCDGIANCQYGDERSCSDSFDNDADGAIDCADTSCHGINPCQASETNCSDFLDNDADGATDCQDDACALTIGCRLDVCPPGSTEVNLVGAGLPLAVAATTSVSLSLAGPSSGTVTLVGVNLMIEHPYADDLDITLSSPTGTTLIVTSDNGGSADDYADTTFLDAASTAIADGAAPFTGAYQPEQAFAMLAGEPAAGAWTLFIDDDTASNDGTVVRASVLVCTCEADHCESLACRDGLDTDGDGLIDCEDSDCATDATCLPEAACADGIDDDLDGDADCLDADCDGIAGCEYLAEVSCADGVDNDRDGLTDCLDAADCAGADRCLPEADCGDGIDDDLDGDPDCQDLGCDGVGGCEYGEERTCFDGVDNDGDGAADCGDRHCAGDVACVGPACPLNSSRVVLRAGGLPAGIPDSGTVTSTVVGPSGRLTGIAVGLSITHPVDSELDVVLISPGGTRRELTTDNGATGDDYRDAVFMDGATTLVTAGAAPFTGMFRPEWLLAILFGELTGGPWTLSVTDDSATDVGTLDEWSLYLCFCRGGDGCEVLACRDGSDSDGDGLVDCADPDCALDPFCVPEEECGDLEDNDLDGLVDCQDPTCDGWGGCEYPAEGTCDDGFDNDGDGLDDCADADCAAAPGCG